MIKLAHFLACDWSVITSEVLSLANSSNLQIPLFRMIYTDTAPCLLLSFGLQILYKTWNIQSQTFFLMIWILGATSIEKIPKISASGRNFLDPPPPPLRKGPYRRKRRYFVPNSNYKVRFFQTSNPPPYFIRKPNLTDFTN